MFGWRFCRNSSSQAFLTLALALIWACYVGAGARAFAQQPYGVSPPSGTSWVLTFDDEFTQDSSSIQMSFPPSGSITTSEGTWTWGIDYGGSTCTSSNPNPYCSPTQWETLLNGNVNDAGELLELVGGQLYLSDGPSSYYIRQNGSWVPTSDPSLGVGPVNASKWNGGAGGLNPRCGPVGSADSGGTFIFAEDPNNPCGQYYDGLSLSSTNGLVMQSPGPPSAAIQTGGPTNGSGSPLFGQQYGYWEASFEVPSASDGEGGVANHSDFWMHAPPLTTSWCPEFDVGERPTWNSSAAASNTQMSFGVADCNGGGPSGLYGDANNDDLSAGFHKYGLSWLNDGSGPYGSIQMYLDGVPLFSSRYTLSSSNSTLASGLFMWLSVDNDGVGYANPFKVQYVRVWQDVGGSGGGIDTSAWYEVVSQDSGFCIDDYGWGTSNGTVLDQWPCAQQSNQEWQFRQAATSGYYAIVSRYASPLVVDNYGSVQNGGGVYLWTYSSGDANQEWQPQNLGNGLWRFVSLDSGECLDNDGSVTDGSQMITWTCSDGNPNQEFSLVKE